VKQSDLGEYEKNAREKQKYTIYKAEALSPSQTKSYGWQHQFPTQEGSNQTTRFLNAKGHTPSEAKVKHTKRQPQDKHRPLNQQS
jgi:hypothetical protein